MFKETLLLQTKLDGAALNKMDRLLNSRFAKVSKSFGKGLLNVVKGGGWVGITLGLIDKFLNPLKETQEAIERSLNQADDLETSAEQFNSSAGELFKLQRLAGAKGLDADALNMMLIKYQGAIAEAQADPKKDTSVRAYADDKNIVASFYQFLQNLSKVDKNKQILVEQEIFGEKSIGKMSEFVQAANDFGGLEKRIGLRDSTYYDPAAKKLGALSDKQSELREGRNANDFVRKGQIINGGMINSIEEGKRVEQEREDQRILNFKNLQQVSISMEKIMTLVEKGVGQLGELIGVLTPMATKFTGFFNNIKESKLFRLLPKVDKEW